jgi:hypothetical protein
MNVHVISADPNQRVGSAPTPTASDYQEVAGDGTNSWSRAVEAFRTRLTQLGMDINAKALAEQATRLAEYVSS